MTDDPKKRKQDAKLVSAEQPYEVRYFAKKHRLTTAQAREIIETFGPSREACNGVVENIKFRAFLESSFRAEDASQSEGGQS